MPNTIPVPFPHMALNSHDVPPPDYLMFNTWKVDKSISVDHIVGWVGKVAGGMPGGKIKTLIFNAHGSPGSIHIGQGINLTDLHKFQAWSGLVEEIWIIACRVAGKDAVSGGIDGESFCKDLALATGAQVTAAMREQHTGMKEIPIGFVDEWEGKVVTYDKNGKPKIRQHDNASYNE